MSISDRALLVMDFQDEIVASVASSGVVERTAVVLAAARKAGMPVFFVVVGFRPGYPEVSPNNKSFSTIKQSGRVLSLKVNDAVKPLDNEPVITKRRVSAFAGSDLDVILRANGIKEMVLAGISTSGVVLSTTRMAADLDYGITILSDCCADGDEEVHRVLMQKVFPRQANVVTGQDFLAML